MRRIPASALGSLRRAIEADNEFRLAIAAGAADDLVDEVGRLWLVGRSGWEADATQLIATTREELASKDVRRDVERAEKRRLAAEETAARLQLELRELEVELDRERGLSDLLRADLAKAEDAVGELRTEVVETRNEVRHARDREAAAVRRATAAEAALDQRNETEGIVVDSRHVSAAESGTQVDPDDLARAISHAEDLLDQLCALASVSESPSPTDRGGAMRIPLALPGGLISTSAEAAAHLMRSNAIVVIDGYNVSKLAWPSRSLEQQRDALIDRVEALARRHSLDVVVVFDGASVVGSHRRGSRVLARVVYSPEGISADDVIRTEVDRVPADRAVVVVTNDREIARDVRAVGANVIPSNAFIAVF